jgi:hypothetical protein
MSCFGQKPRWRTSWLKGAALTASCMGERDERKQTSGRSIVKFSMTSKPEPSLCSGKSLTDNLLNGHAASGV